jgi:hypothetical protein
VKHSLRAPGACLLMICSLLPFDLESGGVRPARAEEPDTANACVGLQNAVGDRQLVIHAGNDCERKLSCTLDYSVRCEDNQQKETSRVQKRALFSLPAKGNAELTLSAATCKQGWAIDDLAWTCR